MAWKTENNQIVTQDGHPVWIYDDGKESPFDAGSALQKIGSVTSESITRKNRLKELESKLEHFKDIENPSEFLTQARAALDTVQNFKDKEVMAAGEVDALKKKVAESYEHKIREIDKLYKTQLEERDSKLKQKDEAVHRLLIKNAFAQSEFLRTRTVLPPDMAFDSFGKLFVVKEVEGELKAVAINSEGQEITSRKEPSALASVDEVLEEIISARKDKDSILRGIQSGSGSTPNIGSAGITDMMKLSPTERINAARRRSSIK